MILACCNTATASLRYDQNITAPFPEDDDLFIHELLAAFPERDAEFHQRRICRCRRKRERPQEAPAPHFLLTKSSTAFALLNNGAKDILIVVAVCI